jgi:hypothetical protein
MSSSTYISSNTPLSLLVGAVAVVVPTWFFFSAYEETSRETRSKRYRQRVIEDRSHLENHSQIQANTEVLDKMVEKVDRLNVSENLLKDKIEDLNRQLSAVMTEKINVRESHSTLLDGTLALREKLVDDESDERAYVATQKKMAKEELDRQLAVSIKKLQNETQTQLDNYFHRIEEDNQRLRPVLDGDYNRVIVNHQTKLTA